MRIFPVAGALALAFALASNGPLLAAGLAATPATPPAFAPPLDRPMDYRVTSRRLGRDGAMINFSLDYRLSWHRSGRGYRLDAMLTGIESDAKPKVKQMLTGMLNPLVGQTVDYLVGADGTETVLMDPRGLWARVSARAAHAGEASHVAEAEQMAQRLASLPAKDREKLIAADIEALAAAANPDIARGKPVAEQTPDSALRTISLTEKGEIAASGTPSALPLQIKTIWTIDPVTGLVMHERRQSWLTPPKSGKPVLMEERIRTLKLATSD